MIGRIGQWRGLNAIGEACVKKTLGVAVELWEV